MRGRRIRIKDLADRLSLSTSTVSRALAGHSDVSAETRQLVNQLADELNYYPDPIAVNLKQRKSNVIGLIVPNIDNRFFAKALTGIQQVVSQHAYNIITSQSNESLEIEKKNVEVMMANRVDGLIVSLARETINAQHFNKILNTDTPIVFFDRVNEGLDTSKVVIDDYEASYKAVKHLIDEGCRRIAHIAGPPNLFNSRKRLEGYKDAIRDHDLYLDKRLIIFASNYQQDAKPYTKSLLSLNSPPDGIFALNDRSAIQIMYYIKQEGLKIPQDIAIVGFNNNELSQYFDPPLSSVESPAEELGQSAAELLFKHIENENLPPSSKVIKSNLIVRDSSLRSKYL
ncbi:LacI family transcriptional regulator [Fulvivirga sp. M361]|uniref:LacI family DNA-binding transcriptional regulator n=1 Tax=Fulvivirga sp. M361 TaxID=2594266 RepID=UPI00117AC055|nr:LacI family DNA-binding transcriptional regulator [Fulvivirga sp. M361]TRX48575.1 LacI family transcriptional regulator [Fulvivirga sp. M361]